MTVPNEADRTAPGMPAEPLDPTEPREPPDRAASPDETLDAGLTPAPPIPGVSETVAPHPALQPGPVGPSPLGPDGGQRPEELGELTR